MTPRVVPCKLKMSRLLKVLEDKTFRQVPLRGWKGCVIVAYPEYLLDLSAVISNRGYRKWAVTS
jgi:phenylacetate-coenzyme A ligase PaaK-like adenylate-forming protein